MGIGRERLPPWLYRLARALLNWWGLRRRVRGAGNVLSLQALACNRVRIDVQGDGNRIVLESEAVLENVTIRMCGNGHRLVVGAGSYLRDLALHFEADGCAIEVGEKCVFCGGKFSAAEAGTAIRIGRGSIVAEGTEMRTTDSHSIIDRSTGERLNAPGDVTLGPGVWVCLDVLILKGVTIGAGTVVGARSVVSRDLPEHCLAAGTPARVLRENVSWVWERLPAAKKPSTDRLQIVPAGQRQSA